MRPEALLIWLSLFGTEPNLPAPSASPAHAASIRAASTWVGEWLVQGDARAMRALLRHVVGREQLAARMTFGEGPAAVVEEWIVRRDGRWLDLSRAGVGGARLSVSEAGALVGRLTRDRAAGEVTLHLNDMGGARRTPQVSVD
jgi:hypothetical protein